MDRAGPSSPVGGHNAAADSSNVDGGSASGAVQPQAHLLPPTDLPAAEQESEEGVSATPAGPALELMLSAMREALPTHIYDKLQLVIRQMLENNLQITKEEFMVWLRLMLRDDNASAMRRACVKGRQRLEERGWLQRDEPDAFDLNAALGPPARPVANPAPAAVLRDFAAHAVPYALPRLEGFGNNVGEEDREEHAQAPSSPSRSPELTPCPVRYKNREWASRPFGLSSEGRETFKATPRSLGRLSAQKKLAAELTDDECERHEEHTRGRP